MSGTSSFLSGLPVPPQPTGADTSTSQPLWYQDLLYNTGTAAQNLAASPYTPNPYQAVAAPSGATQQSWNMAVNNANNYQPYLNQAGALTQQAAQPIGAQQINQYLNPYTNDVVGALQQASNTNFFNNVMPGIQSQFVSAGQAASPQEMQSANNAAYLQSQALNQATAGALQQGYQGAVGTALQEQGQTGAMGAQSGQLGSLTQGLGAASTGLVASAGQGQDTYNQSVLNNNANQFNQAQQWPYQNLGYASNIERGLQVPTNQQTVGMNYNPGQSYTSSPISSFVGGTLGASAATNGTVVNPGALSYMGGTNYARGGRVRRRFAAGGDVTVSPYSDQGTAPLTLDDGSTDQGALGALLAARAPQEMAPVARTTPRPAPRQATGALSEEALAAGAPEGAANSGALSAGGAQPAAGAGQGAISQGDPAASDKAQALQRAMMVLQIANGGGTMGQSTNLPLLAAAGAMLKPTRTGSFSESLGNAFDAGAGAAQQQRQLQEQSLLRGQQQDMMNQWHMGMVGARQESADANMRRAQDYGLKTQADVAVGTARASYLQAKMNLEKSTNGRWTIVGVDTATGLPIELDTQHGTTKLGDQQIGMKPAEAARSQAAAGTNAGRDQRAAERNRTTFIDSYLNSHPNAKPQDADAEWAKLHPPGGSVPQAPARPALPKVGVVEGNHVFLGGDPASQNSWAPVQGGP